MTVLRSVSSTLFQTDYYKVVLMTKGHSNALIVELFDNATDYDPYHDKAPSSTEPRLNEAGGVDYFAEPECSTVKDWKKKLGEFAIKAIVKPEVIRNGGQWPGTPDIYYLANWPRGYRLFTHKKGGRYDHRRDSYLFGSRYVRCFRSPAEFFCHLQWLMAGSPLNSDGEPDCHCAYCDPSVTQGEISQRLSHYHPRDKHQGDKYGKENRPRSKTAVSTIIPAKDYTKLDISSLG